MPRRADLDACRRRMTIGHKRPSQRSLLSAPIRPRHGTAVALGREYHEAVIAALFTNVMIGRVPDAILRWSPAMKANQGQSPTAVAEQIAEEAR